MADIAFMTPKRQAGLFFISLLAAFLPVVLIQLKVLGFTNGVFMYPVDDTYIHMEVARNLAANGTWGINPGEFGSASSSILYTLLLALLFKIFSAHVIIPVLVNSIAAVILLYYLNKWLVKQQLRAWLHFIIILLVIFLTPLPIMILSGMEHTLQCLFSFLFLYHAADWATENDNANRKAIPWKLVLLAMCVTSIRYEGLFLVGMTCLVLIFHRKVLQAFSIGLLSLLPLVVFGFISLSKGSYFLPNSVLIKSGEVPIFGGGIGNTIQTILVEKLTLSKPGITALATQRLLLIVPLAALWLVKGIRQKPSYLFIVTVLTGCIFLHLALASTGKFYRYEAYLFLCALPVVLLIFRPAGNFGLKFPSVVQFFGVIILFFLFFPVFLRTTAAFSKAERACLNIYEQQFQMGKFLRQYYPDAGFAANDIGAVSYFTSGRVTDLWGLGSIDIARSRRGNYWNADFLDSLSRKREAGVAIIYDSWFNNSFQSRWHKLATWQIPDNVVCGDDTVSFYAIDSLQAGQLKKNLLQFQRQLPSEVKVKYFDLNEAE